MNIVLLDGVACWFQLEGRVRDVEVLGETRLASVQDPWYVSCVKAEILDDHVGRQCDGARGQGPRAKAVDIKHIGWSIHRTSLRSLSFTGTGTVHGVIGAEVPWPPFL